MPLDQLNEILVLRHDDVGSPGARGSKDHRIVCAELFDVLYMPSINGVRLGQPSRERRRQLRVHPDDRRRSRSRRHRLRGYVRMVEAPGSVQQARRNVVGVQIREILKDLLP